MLSSCLFINSLETFVLFPIKHFLSQFHYISLRLGHCFSFEFSVSRPNTALQPEKACRNVAAYWGGKQTVQGYCKCFQNKQCTLSRVRTKVHLKKNTNTRCLRQHKEEIPYKALVGQGSSCSQDKRGRRVCHVSADISHSEVTTQTLHLSSLGKYV